MSKAIVDRFEEVDVQHENRKWLFVSGGHRELFLEMSLQETPVVEAGEFVLNRPLLELLEVADVLEDGGRRNPRSHAPARFAPRSNKPRGDCPSE